MLPSVSLEATPFNIMVSSPIASTSSPAFATGNMFPLDELELELELLLDEELVGFSVPPVPELLDDEDEDEDEELDDLGLEL